MLEFKRLPAKMKSRNGVVVQRIDATTPFFSKLVADLRKKKSPVLEEAERALALMKQYGTRRGVHLTWGEVVELEAEAATKKAGKKK